MEQILFINACVRTGSRTMQLAQHVLSQLEGACHTCQLQDEGLLPLNRERLANRDALLAKGKMDDACFRWAKQFAQADTIVIAAPYWELSFPALLKIYLENITVTGITFTYENNRPVGLCRAKRLIYVTTAGGPIFADFGFAQVEALARNFFGIREVLCCSAEGLDIIGADVTALLENAKNCFERELKGEITV